MSKDNVIPMVNPNFVSALKDLNTALTLVREAVQIQHDILHKLEEKQAQQAKRITRLEWQLRGSHDNG